MFNHAIRITLPYEDCSGIIWRWADRCKEAIAYQHDADEEVSKTHVHLGLYGCEVKAEQLKRMWADAPGKGNEFWSWKEASVEATKYLTYMSKGTLRPKMVKNFSNDLVEKSRQLWVEPVLGNDKVRDSSERIISKILARFTPLQKSRYYRDDDGIQIGHVKYNLDLLMNNVRTEAFKMLWGERRMAPHASHYKIVATTVFLRLCEDAGCLDEAIGFMKNLWY